MRVRVRIHGQGYDIIQYYNRVFAIYQVMLGWKHANIITKPMNSRTQGQPDPRRLRWKVAFGLLFFPWQTILRGSGLVLYRKQTTRNLTNQFCENTPMIHIGKGKDTCAGKGRRAIFDLVRGRRRTTISEFGYCCQARVGSTSALKDRQRRGRFTFSECPQLIAILPCRLLQFTTLMTFPV